MSEQSTIRWEQDADGIVVLTLDDPSQSANTMNAAYLKSMRATVDRLVKEKDSISGVVLTSAKKTFFAGGDLKDLLKVRKEDAKQAFELGQEIKAQLRALETLGKPVVAAINGAALGGGLEIALACHRRIVADVKGVQVGLPEVTLGLLPGGGGVVRTVRMLGIVDALMKVLLQGQRYRPQEAKDVGLVHEVVDSVEALLPAAKAWVKANPSAQQPWDVKGYKIPGGTPTHPGLAANLPAFPANLRKQLKGANMPAPRAIMAVAVEGTQVDVDTAFTIESRYFTELVTGQVAKNMIQAFFFDMQHINSGGGRPKGFPQYTAKKVGVLGAGMMGAGIAYVCAKAGIDVVLKDVSLASAEKGKQYSVKLVEKAIQRGKSTKEKGDALLARITPTTDAAALKGCDVVIEAVFEDVKLKHQVFQEVQDMVAPDALLASNTSTLPISLLAEGVKRTDDFVGMHFFSPVDKMPLLELIAGKKTSDAALAKAIDIAVQIGKTPIVVNDSRGFFTSRVIGTFLNEAIAMVGEGIAPASIEQAGLQAGYPAAPLSLMDELTLTLPRKIRQETKAAALAEGKPWVEHGSYAVVDALIDQHQRKGRSTGGGFYDYEDGKRAGLWKGLAQHFTKPGHTIPFEDMKDRMLFAEAVDTVRCFDEGVLRSAADANIGSILGIGFPAWTGGVAQFINGYEGPTGTGLRGFITRARELAAKYGPHFEPPASLVAKAEKGELLK
ncbi:3-hydroxyacyl-CoA dehydrogenase NAD-binding domain-containing protein [Comamonas sp. JC664]|uniref:3-hydroxyacyl-CoA dehydrogenase NAD-binding domain-containing protein n=1 Tax=Comamonas sp. JC664 TaxID=2801917 RepID=UPI001747F43C|nr:3-hydroxyacyl-CoA dehydrogenase NAD-binding domain-containing protein [Comamonas sp. JC664]MBL0698871.1 enoyl-CoA hydratase/isomerase family protein [Comamonas sp. JC664]GHG79316.1 3-hydroxyacyl-CoA dehydrogenase [Comamonas sp. KCTC 72670]